MNRTDDPLGKDASNLGIAVTDATNPVCYKLEISGDFKTQYTVGEDFDLTGARSSPPIGRWARTRRIHGG